ncbi:MAG TPA: ComF family protein [Candidatus Vogelbacteria bacterium]|nr:ComF family protein [Candidatus Vogelbacteria bacterium]
MIQKILEKLASLLDILFPYHCPGCDRTTDAPCCQKCFKKISPQPFFHKDNRISLFDYNQEIIKKMIWKIKWENGFYEALMLIKKAEKIIADLGDLLDIKNKEKIILIPLPQSKKRLKKRGYNQTELIAKALCKLKPDNYLINHKILYKKEDIRPQTELELKTKRIKNIIDAFYLKNEEQTKKQISDKNVIIIDDVTTTGATLCEALKEINKARPKIVIGLALAG